MAERRFRRWFDGSGRRLWVPFNLDGPQVVFENRRANSDAFVADVGSRVVGWTRNQLSDVGLGLMAEGTLKHKRLLLPHRACF